MTQILHRHNKTKLTTAVSGNGVYIEDNHGKRYLDACGGAAVSCLGHSNARVINAIKQQLDAIPFAHTSFFTSAAAEQLADKLVSLAPEGITKAYFVSGGTEANEAAIKLARQYFYEKGETDRVHFIAREQSYHGNTIATLGMGGNEWRKAMFQPILPKANLIPPCYAYRHQLDGESEEAFGLRMANELETKILELGAETVIAFFAEPVVGATAGAVPPAKGYFKRIREICDQYGILLVLDEVMCGTGRTGTLFASEQEGINPDIVTLAKGIGGGYVPLGATLLSQTIFDVLDQGTGFFQHGHTYICHPTSAAAALAVLEEIEQHELLANVLDKGEKITNALHAQFDEHPYIGDIRGRGLFLGIEFVEDKANKTPFSSQIPLANTLKKAALDNGLMIYPMLGTINGREGHHALIAPPFIYNDSHVDELITKLSTTFNQVFD